MAPFTAKALVQVVLLALTIAGEVFGQTAENVSLLKSQHLRLTAPADIQRLAVGDPDIMAAEPISSREILLLGKAAGRTTLIVWFRDGSIRQYVCTVRRDFSVLMAALHRIHPSIDVDIAPDRDAVILTGLVPDVTYSQAAESVARNYLEAGGTREASGAGRTLIRGEGQQPPAEPPAPLPAQPTTPQPGQQAVPQPQETIRVPALLPPTGTVINLIRLQNLPPLAEEKIRQTMQSIGGEKVSVRRVLRGAIRDDSKDVFVLEGAVPNQVALIRVLSLAAQIVTGRNLDEDDIRVVADEAGALAGRTQDQSQQSGQGLGLGSGTGVLGGAGSGNRASRLNNQIRRNLARAKVVEAAGGRILSFIQVADLPQVRVDIRLFEVNRTRLRTYNTSTAALASDFRQPGLLPAAGAQLVQGGRAASVSGQPAVQDVLAFLGGTLSNQLQFTAGRFAIDTVFSLLERHGIARSLSSPSLTVLSGELAQFQVGGEIPVPEAFVPILGTGGTGGATGGALPNGIFSSVFFQPFGVQLGIRPLVDEGDFVTLDVLPQIVTPNADLTASLRQTTGTNPLTTAFNTRALRTSARLQDGQALLIGGLLSRNTSDNQTSTPGLRDIAGLGWLFKAFERSDEGLELVVVLNPALLRDLKKDVPLWEFPPTQELLPPGLRSKASGGTN